MDITPAQAEAVASFYDMFNLRPVGRHIVEVCTNLSCMVRDAYGIYQRLCQKLGVHPGQMTADGKFTVTEVECLGSCGTAPVVQINNDYHENLTVDEAEKIVDRLAKA